MVSCWVTSRLVGCVDTNNVSPGAGSRLGDSSIFPIRFVSFSPGQSPSGQAAGKSNHDKAKPEAPAQNGRRGGGRRGQEAARPLLATLGWLVWALAGDESNKRRRQVSREASVPSCASKALTIEAPTRGARPPPPPQEMAARGWERLGLGKGPIGPRRPGISLQYGALYFVQSTHCREYSISRPLPQPASSSVRQATRSRLGGRGTRWGQGTRTGTRNKGTRGGGRRIGHGGNRDMGIWIGYDNAVQTLQIDVDPAEPPPDAPNPSIFRRPSWVSCPLSPPIVSSLHTITKHELHIGPGGRSIKK